eukprot:1281280-Rhodomonas_salina.1
MPPACSTCNACPNTSGFTFHSTDQPACHVVKKEAGLTFWMKLHRPRSTRASVLRTGVRPTRLSHASPTYVTLACTRPGGSTMLPNQAGAYRSA